MTIATRAVGLMLPALLSGCAATSIKGLQKRPPALTVDSGQETSSIATCVSAAWLALGVTPRSVPRDNGTMLVLGDAVPALVVDMTSIPGGTHVVMHQLKSMWSDNNRHRVEEVRACL